MKRYLLLLSLLIPILFGACTDGGAGIFYSIENEEPIANKALSDYLTSQTSAVIGTDYYLPAGYLYHWDSTQPSSDWSKVGLPSGWTYTWQVATNGSTYLYAILENTDGDDSGLFIYDGSSWTSEISVGTGRPYKVWTATGGANDGLYVATITTIDETSNLYEYRLYYSADISTTSPSFTGNIVQIGVTDFVSNNPIRDLDYDGSTVYFITSTFCASGTGTGFTSQPVPANMHLRYLYYSPAFTTLYMSASTEAINGTGYVYTWSAGWTALQSFGTDLNDLADVTANGGTPYLLIGNQSGYYESTTGTSFTGESATIDSNYTNTDLEGAVVNGFFDGPGDTFYAMTSSNGLWRNSSKSWDLE